jgi:spermidine synthase
MTVFEEGQGRSRVAPPAGTTAGGLLVPTLLFGCFLTAGTAAGALLTGAWRLFGLTAGSTAEAGLALVGAIALGAGLGGTFGGHAAGRTAAPGRLLALLLAGFGLSALLSAPLSRAVRAVYPLLWPALGGSAAGVWLLRFVLASALVALPAALFAAALPNLARLIVAGRQGFGVACGFTLGLSLAGLGIGAVVAGTLFIPGEGIRGTLFLGVALAGIAAGGLVLLRQGGLEGPGALGTTLASAEAPAPAGEEDILLDEETIAGGTLAAANVLVGFSAWSYYTAWSRTLASIVGGAVPEHAVLVALFLGGLALGAFLIAGFAERVWSLLGLLAVLLAGSSIVANASMHLVPNAAALYLRLTPLLARPALSLLPAAAAAAPLMLPASILLGGALTLLPLASRARGRPMAATIGFLALGVFLADLIVGLEVIPAFGLRRTVSLAGAVGLIAAILFMGGMTFRRPAFRATATVGLLGLMVALGGFPATWDPRLISAGLYRYGARSIERLGSAAQYEASRRGVEVLFYREGRNATTMVERTLQPAHGGPPVENLALKVDGKIEAGTGDDIRTQVLQAHLPILVHGPTESVLVLGFLDGVAAGSVLRHPVTSLTIVEREPALFEAAAPFSDYNRRPLEDSRVTTIADSARARLNADPRSYDVVLITTMDPWLPESASLLTSEGVRLLKSRLRPGGLVAQRVALSSTTEAALRTILRTYVAAFDSILVFQISPEDLLLLASSEPLAIDVGWLQNVLSSSASVKQDLARVIPLGVDGLLLEFRMGREGLKTLVGDGPLDSDDRSIVEVASYRPIAVHDNGRLLEAVGKAWAGITPFLKNYGALPDDRAAFLYGLAKAYLGVVADPVRARESARELQALGKTAMARWVTGECLLQERDVDGALGEWRAVLETDPDNLDALFSLGSYYQDNSDYPRAETYLARAAARYADTPVVVYTHGRNLYLLERYREAIEELSKVRSLAGAGNQYPVVDYIVGVSLHRLGKDQEAADRLQTYLKWAYGQSMLTRLEVDAHLKLAEVYDKLGHRFQAHQEKQKGEDLLQRIKDYAMRAGGAGGTAQSATGPPGPGAAAPEVPPTAPVLPPAAPAASPGPGH